MQPNVVIDAAKQGRQLSFASTNAVADLQVEIVTRGDVVVSTLPSAEALIDLVERLVDVFQDIDNGCAMYRG